MRTKTTITEDIIQYVKENPGAQSQEIFDALPRVDKLGTVHNTLARLSREGVLENRGGSINRHAPAKWHCTEPRASDYARELARNIYSEMMKLHSSVREELLAEKLEELLEES